MASFTDMEGRKWSPRVTVDVIIAWERSFKFSFIDVAPHPDQMQKHLFGSIDRIAGVLYRSVYKEAKARGVSEKAFPEAFDGATLQSAALALKEAISEFWPEPEPDRPSPESLGDGTTSGKSPGPSESTPES